MRNKVRYALGLALTEVVVVASIILVFVVALFGAYAFYLRISFENLHRAQATFIAEEGIESIKILRDQSWSEKIALIPFGETYRITWNEGLVELALGASYIDGMFDRTIVFEEVGRDSNGDIVEQGGTPDEGTRKLTVNISWFSRNATTTKSMSTYVTDLFGN